MFKLLVNSSRLRQAGRVSLLAAAGLALASCGGNSQLPAAVTISTRVATASGGDVEQRIFNGLNAYREHRGLTKQVRHSGLDDMARDHAQRMLAEGKLAHDNYEYREGFAVKRYQISGLSENILRAFRVPKGEMAATAVKGWIESRGHRINVESMNSHVGIGVAFGEEGTFYAVHLSGTPLRKSAWHAGIPRSYGNIETQHELDW